MSTSGAAGVPRCRAVALLRAGSFAFVVSSALVTPGPDAESADGRAPVAMPPAARTFYVDERGRDDASGRSPSEAWATLARVAGNAFEAGDRVLFRRGGTWRGQLKAASGAPGRPVVYAAYGSGERPLFLGSVDRSAARDWRESAPGLWSTGKLDRDVGHIALFDRVSGAMRFGIRRWANADLTAPLMFAYDAAARAVILRHEGNPAERHGRIELAITRDVVTFAGRHDVVFESLAVRHGGAHGFAGAATARITVRDCQISYLGGGKLHGRQLRYGNGVEFWGDASDSVVEGNEIFQIYDSAVTNQNEDTPAIQQRIVYRHNSISDCGMASFEVWSRPATSRLADIRFEHNTCLRAGGGWGGDLAQRGRHVGGHVALFSNPAATAGVTIRDNVFSEAASWLVYADTKIPWWTAAGALELDHNCWHSSTPERAAFFLVGQEAIAFRNHSRFVGRMGGNDRQSRFADPRAGADFRLPVDSPCAGLGRTLW